MDIKSKTTIIKQEDFSTKDYRIRFKYEDDKLKSVFVDCHNNKFQSMHFFNQEEINEVADILNFIKKEIKKVPSESAALPQAKV